MTSTPLVEARSLILESLSFTDVLYLMYLGIGLPPGLEVYMVLSYMIQILLISIFSCCDSMKQININICGGDNFNQGLKERSTSRNDGTPRPAQPVLPSLLSPPYQFYSLLPCLTPFLPTPKKVEEPLVTMIPQQSKEEPICGCTGEK